MVLDQRKKMVSNKYRSAEHRRKRRRQRKRRMLLIRAAICLCAVAAVFAGFHILNRGNMPDAFLNKVSQNDNTETEIKAIDDWKLVLANDSNPLPDGFTVETKDIPNNGSVDQRIYDSLMEFLSDGKKAGMQLLVCSSYRSIDRQKELFQQEIEENKAKGLSDEEAYAAAKKAVAIPGTSEHNLGLAVDICSLDHQVLDDALGETPEGLWMRENASNYGFILRYPKDKQDITGIIYEPWHFRYVGEEHAKKMEELNMCLEEYLVYLKEGNTI